MSWVAIAALLAAWFVGFGLGLGPPVHLLLLAAAGLLLVQAIRARGEEGEAP